MQDSSRRHRDGGAHHTFLGIDSLLGFCSRSRLLRSPMLGHNSLLVQLPNARQPTRIAARPRSGPKGLFSVFINWPSASVIAGFIKHVTIPGTR